MQDANIINGASDAQIADWLEQRLRAALELTDGRGGTVPIALPGGSTPFPILELLVQRDLEWSRICIEPTDDRDVPEDHSASNTGKLRALFEPLGAHVTSLAQLEETGRAPCGDYRVVWLGMGTDGHIASLFPNTDPAVDDDQWLRRLTPDPLPPEAPFDRLTLTMPALLSCDEFLFVIRGDEKRDLFTAGLSGQHDLPIARLLSARNYGHHRPVTCFT